jgi:hypothetical protein
MTGFLFYAAMMAIAISTLAALGLLIYILISLIGVAFTAIDVATSKMKGENHGKANR